MRPPQPPPLPSPHGAPGADTPVYVISVAAELTGLHPQTLRTYDRLGLVSPGRTGGGGRRYSLRDIEMLREIAQLSAMGIGLEGVRRILDLENHVTALQLRVAELEAQLEAQVTEAQPADTEASLKRRAGSAANLPVLAYSPPTRTVVVWRRRYF